MSPAPEAQAFYVWGADNTAYGPVELSVLATWAEEGRVQANTWVFSGRECVWKLAREIPGLQPLLKPAPEEPVPALSPAFKPGALRRVKVFAHLSDAQLARFARFMEIARAPQHSTLVCQGEHGDAMYVVLEGELQVRLLVEGRETLLVTLGPGDCFGEIALFDHGPRSADIIAARDTFLLKISAGALQTLTKQAPDLAAAFLLGVAQTMAARVRADNQRLSDTLSLARAARL